MAVLYMTADEASTFAASQQRTPPPWVAGLLTGADDRAVRDGVWLCHPAACQQGTTTHLQLCEELRDFNIDRSHLAVSPEAGSILVQQTLTRRSPVVDQD